MDTLETRVNDMETIIRRMNIELWSAAITLSALRSYLVDNKIIDEEKLKEVETKFSKEVAEELEKKANEYNATKGNDSKDNLPPVNSPT